MATGPRPLRRASNVAIGVIEPGRLPDQLDRPLTLGLGGAAAGLRDGVFFCEGLPAVLCRRLQGQLDIKPNAVA